MVGLKLLLKLGKRPAWSPYDIPRSVLRAWWNADDHGIAAFMTDDGAGLISSWWDRIGGLALTAAAGARPTYGATAFNSAKPGLTFDGTANTLASTTLTNLPTSSTPGFIMAVADPGTTKVAAEIVFAYGNDTAGQSRRFQRNGTGNSSTPRTFDGGSTLTVSGGSAWSTPGIIGGSFDSTVSAWLNGTLLGTSGAGTLATTATRIRMGAALATSAASFLSGVVRHVFVTAALTTLQRQQLEGWVAWDCGLQSLLPASHPYVAGPP